MQYYVIGPDGNRYGPADVPTLRQWVLERRILPQSLLEDVRTGQRMPATAVLGPLEMPGQPMPGAYPEQPTAYQGSPYARPAYDNGANELTYAIVFLVLGFVCCPFIFCPLGVWKANQAMAKGNPSAKVVRILNYVFLIISCVGTVIEIFLITSGAIHLPSQIPQ
jgi:hypothetical protein